MAGLTGLYGHPGTTVTDFNSVAPRVRGGWVRLPRTPANSSGPSVQAVSLKVFG